MGKNKKAGNSFMNPTDRMRREARKRELKKNKKQRLIVRNALLKGKDPYQIISELERLDKMEFDYYNPPPLNAKVLSDKRRKLKDTWDRVIRLYIKEDKEKFQELKRIESEYEAKRNELIKNYEAIKSAQEVSLDEIPLPMSLPNDASTRNVVNNLDNTVKPHSILKNSKSQLNKEPPGCPSGIPPSWSDYEQNENDDESEFEEIFEEDGAKPKKRIRFKDEDDNDVDDSNNDDGEKKDNLSEFLKEIEQISGDKDNVSKVNKADEVKTKSVEENSNFVVNIPVMSTVGATPTAMFYPNPIQPAPPIIPDLPNVRPLPPCSFPTLSMPVNTSTSIPQLPVKSIHLMPRPLLPHLPAPPQSSSLPGNNQHRKVEKSQTATIEARPQLRNLSADTTKFMPLALRIKRKEKPQPIKKTNQPMGYGMIQSSHYSDASKETQTKSNAKDDAYEEFMKEMSNLI